MGLSEDFLKHLCQKYPGLKLEDQAKLQSLISENLLSQFDVPLPIKIKNQAEEIIKNLFEMTHEKKYLDFYKSEVMRLSLHDPKNYGIMMSYDFHLDSEQNLKLIEVNTNAAFLALGSELYEMKKISPQTQFTNLNLKNCVLEELALNQQSTLPHKVAIVDEQPESQRLYIEFLVTRELFRSFGFQSEILDSQNSNIDKYDFIYNRDTDFFLSEPRTQLLRDLYVTQKACVSPNPFEYYLTADKQRMIDWGNPDWQKNLNLTETQISLIQKHVPQSYDFTAKSKEEIWDSRKNFFFKPKRAYGSKHTFKGSSISRKTFETLDPDKFMAQEYIAAPEVECSTDSGPQKFKYDLRCYAYQGQLQLVMARIYQGQVTNLKTPGGGFACIQFQG